MSGECDGCGGQMGECWCEQTPKARGRTFVVAEAGCVHEGSLETMLRLIEAAHAAGCDAFKNQYLGNPEEVRRRRKSDYASYDWLNYPLEWHVICRERCNSLGMQYGCSTNLAEDLAKVAPYVQFHKRPSFENNDMEWLAAAKESGQLFMVSAGMLEREGLLRLIEQVDEEGDILHCTSSYPAPIDSLNLRAIQYYGLDGFSDHSRNLRAGAAAVGVGARIVEAHLRLEDTDERNPDHAVAFTPEQFECYVWHLREAEAMLGDGVKRIHESEAPMLRYRIGVTNVGD